MWRAWVRPSGNTAYYINVLLTIQVAALSNCLNSFKREVLAHMYIHMQAHEAQDTPPIRHLLNVLAFPATIKLTRKAEIAHSLASSCWIQELKPNSTCYANIKCQGFISLKFVSFINGISAIILYCKTPFWALAHLQFVAPWNWQESRYAHSDTPTLARWLPHTYKHTYANRLHIRLFV